MERKKVFLITQSLLCALVAGLLAGIALYLYFEGAAKQAAGDLFYYSFTREKAGGALRIVLPVFAVSLGLTITGLILGIRDENADKPVRDPDGMRDAGSLRDRAVHQKAERKTVYLRAAVLVLAAALILAGILNGGMEDVLAKGAAICTECIGLG